MSHLTPMQVPALKNRFIHTRLVAPGGKIGALCEVTEVKAGLVSFRRVGADGALMSQTLHCGLDHLPKIWRDFPKLAE